MDGNLEGDDVLTGDDLKRRWLAIAACMEAMGREASKLMGALKPGDLPDEMVRKIEATTRPFTAEIGKFMAECRGFQDYSRRLEEAITQRARAANYDAFFEQPMVGKAVN